MKFPRNHVNGRAHLPPYRYPTDDEFEIPLSEGDEPTAGLTQRTQKTQQPQRTQQPLVVEAVSSVSTRPEIAQAIECSLPGAKAGWKRAVFRLARALKAIPHFSTQNAGALRPVVAEWYARATGILNGDLPPLEEVRADFYRAWPKVKYVIGEGPLDTLFKRAERREVPEVALQYQQSKLRLLVALCWELQANAGDAAWPLSCREAGRLLGVSHQTAADWLFLLVQDDILELVNVGNQIGLKASEYRVKAGVDQ